MGLKSAVIKPYAKRMAKKVREWSRRPFEMQDKIFAQLIEQGKKTLFGKDHQFEQIRSYEDFKNKVPVKDYEGIRDYVEKIKKGGENVLWPGKPVYFAKT